jgi:hypothetical protein
MCDQVTKNKVEVIVNDFVSKGYMFTAWDVTKSLRNSGERISHRDVQDTVKEMWNLGNMTDYTRDTKHIGAPVAPFVYYHQNSDVNDYQADWMENNTDQDGMKNDGIDSTPTAVSNQSPVPVIVSVSTSIPTTGNTNGTVNAPVRTTSVMSVVREVTNENRLNIPIKMLEAAGFIYTPHTDFVATVLNKNSIVIENKNQCFNNRIVDDFIINMTSDGRIRLGRDILDCISIGDKFNIERNGAKIIVTPA